MPTHRTRAAALLVWGCTLCAPAAACPAFAPADTSRRAALAAELETVFCDQLEVWYPRVVDTTYGGFLSTFSHDWQPEGPQDKMIVSQSRHVWTASKAAAWYPGDPRYRTAAAHGFAFLRDRMWDAEHGGFFDLVDRSGAVRPGRGGEVVKTAYGNAFAIFGLAAYYRTTGDTAALGLARRGFDWLEAHSHDERHGGYFQFVSRDGTPLRSGHDGTPPKDQNSSIHLLEAFTELYAARPDSLVGARLAEMLHLIRDTMVAPPGYLQLFFDEAWHPVSYRDSTEAVREANEFFDHVSYGHDVETAFLMLEAAHTLGLPDDPATTAVARRMVDHALRFGWDAATGGFHDRGYYFDPTGPPAVLSDAKVWWAQAEALNTLLLFADAYPHDPHPYLERFEQLWAYAKTYLIDFEHGGWYEVGIDREPHRRTGRKAHIWKANYHTARALMNSIRRLASAPAPHE